MAPTARGRDPLHSGGRANGAGVGAPLSAALVAAAVALLALLQPTAVEATAAVQGSGPFPELADPVHVPVLSFDGGGPVCRSLVAIQNVGDEPGKIALLTWGDGPRCAPDCGGPSRLECSGIVRPGGSWVFARSPGPAAALSGVAYSFNARDSRELGPGGAQAGGLVADAMCEALQARIVGDCDEYRRFKAAYETAGDYAGARLGFAYGPALAAEVWRACPGRREKVAEVTASYAAVAGSNFGGFDRFFDVSSYHATIVRSSPDGASTALYIQNGGDNCASVAVWLQASASCGRPQLCAAFTLAQGATRWVDAAGCASPLFEGSAWINSTEPLAIAVDVVGPDYLTTYTAVPAELKYAHDAPPLFTEGSRVAYGPLIYGRDQGWETRVHVQNLSSGVDARVWVHFLDSHGAPLAPRQHGWICQRGSRTFGLPAVHGGVDPPLGSVRVVSVQGRLASGSIVDPPNISAVLELERARDPGSGAGAAPGTESLAYNLLSEDDALEWPLEGSPAGGTATSGVGLIAVPAAINGSSPGDVTTELAIANLVPIPGTTNVVLMIYDQNGLVDVRCRSLDQLEVAYVDLGTVNGVTSGLRGSSVISAASWRHPVASLADRPTAAADGLVGLAAVVVHHGNRRATGAEAAFGDVYGAAAGVPILHAGRGLSSVFSGPAEAAGCPPLPAAVPTATPDMARPVYLPACRLLP